MEFLVRIEAHLPDGMDAARREELLAAELKRGMELHEKGVIKRIWRLPGRRANISLYEAADTDELHTLLTSLPLWPWLTLSVEALANHPVEAARGQVISASS